LSATPSETQSLHRTLGLLEATVGGVGVILGAGIYALVGEVAGRAGNGLWISFILAAVMASLVGLGYAEMSSAVPQAGADYEYTRRALGQRAGFVVGWLMVIANLVAAAAVALGFGAYLHTFVDVSPTLSAMMALVAATLVAFLGVKQAVWVSIAMTVVEVAGLAFIIATGVPHLGDTNLLVTNVDQGRDLAGALAANKVVLMCGHGFAAAGGSLIEAVRISVYLPKNAKVYMEALRLGEVRLLSPGEIEHKIIKNPEAPENWRAWEYWATRAGCGDMLETPPWSRKE